MYVTPGVVVDGELVTTNLVDINLGHPHPARQLVLRRLGERGDVRPTATRSATRSTSAIRGTRRRCRSRRSATSRAATTSWVMSPRWYDKRTGDHLALDTGGGALARLWATALAGKVDTPFVNATGNSVQITLPEDAGHARDGPRVEGPAVVERDRARPRAGVLHRLRGRRWRCTSCEKALDEVRAGRHEGVRGLRRPGRGDRLRLPRGGARRAVAPPGDPRREDRELPPVPADAVERQPDGLLRDARARTRTRSRGSRSSRRTARTNSGGSTSCARCGASTRACRAACTCTSAAARRWSAALADVRRAARLRGGWTSQTRASASRGWRRCLDEVEALPDAGRARAARRERGAGALLDLYGEGLARIVGARRPDPTALPAARTSWSRTCCCCTGSTRCRSRSACARRSRRCGRIWSRTAATSSCVGRGGRRRPAAAAGKLQRLPVLDGDAQARDRGRDPEGGAGRRGGRGGGRRRPRRPAPAVLQLELRGPRPTAPTDGLGDGGVAAGARDGGPS